MNMLARRRGLGTVQRVQFIGDGATWIQKIWEHAFKSCGAIRTLDFVHAAGYLHKLLETVSASGELATDYKRFKGILKKWGGKSLLKNLTKKFGKALEEIDGDAKKALASHYCGRHSGQTSKSWREERNRPHTFCSHPTNRLRCELTCR